MSIYIKGMEMPTSCVDCRFHKNIYCTLTDICTNTAQGCPLIPVPEHGRLIDEQWLKDAMITTLEALKKNPKMDKQEMHLIAAFDTLRVMVEDAPTVIPASEEGEG